MSSDDMRSATPRTGGGAADAPRIGGGAADAPARRPARTIPDWVGYLKMAVFDIGGPLVVYQVAKHSGAPLITCLLLSMIPPLLGVVLEFALKRRVEAIGVFVIAGIAVGVVLGLLTDDPKLVLVEGAVKTFLVAAVMAGSAILGKPAMYLFWLGSFGGPDTARGQWLEEQNRTNPGMRRLVRNGTYAFAGMMLLIGALDLVVVYTMPVDTAQFWNRIDFIPGAILFTIVWVAMFRRAQQRGEVDFESIPGATKDDGTRSTDAGTPADSPDARPADPGTSASAPSGR